ncbi:MAG: kelch repeat-containing protein [Deltaproteobacteria bacterium]|nr:kelch repeat-containing protein [Deltaproteobacteria bacterium]
MRARSLSTALVLAPLACAVLALGSCTKLVNLDLTIVEPCGQETQALNGVQSYRLLSTGATPDGVTAFPATQSSGISIGLGNKVIVTVEGYADDITLGDDPNVPTVAPKSVGRTMPLLIDETTANLKGTVLVGKVDSFGAPRDLEGNCSSMGDNGSAIEGRHGHTATYLPSINQVLIFGGAVWTTEDGAPVEAFLKSAEVFDVTTGTFTKLPDPDNARVYHTATALPDGRVVVLGGLSKINGQTLPLINGEIIDVRQADPYQTIVTKVPRTHHTATFLADVGLIVVAGGCTGGVAQGCGPNLASGGTGLTPSVEIVDINGDLTITKAATGSLSIPRAFHQAVGFPSGNAGVIAIIGGLNETGALRGVELLKLDGGSVINVNSTPDALPRALVRHQATVFNGEQFAVTGGQDLAPGGVLSDTAPGVNEMVICSKVDAIITCAGGANLQTTRYGHAMARLRDGTLVVVGGVAGDPLATAETLRQVPGSGDFAWVPTAGALPVARQRAAFTLLGGDSPLDGFVNQVFYSGGHSVEPPPFVTSTATDIYFGR